MKKIIHHKIIAVLLIILIITLPIGLAQDLNLEVDSLGNLISGDGFYREYDDFNQLIRIRNSTSTGTILEEFVWHPTEERVFQKKVYYNNGSLKEKVYYTNQNVIKIKNDSGTFYETYVYQDNTLVAFVDASGNKKFVHSDHEGSVSLVTDISGNVVEDTFYSVYGEVLQGGRTSRFDFTGKEYDSQVQDYDFHARRYRPDWGIFLQCDTVKPNIYRPQALNCYSYGLNNPFRYIDESGHSPTEPFGRGVGNFKDTFNYYYDSITTDIANTVSGWWGNQYGHEYVENAVDTSVVGTSYDVASYANSEFKKSIWGPYFVPEEEIRTRRNRAIDSVSDEIGDRGITYFFPPYEAVNKGYGVMTGHSLGRDIFNRVSNVVNSLIQMVTNSGSSSILFGGTARSDYSPAVGAYVTSGGKVYPTKNKDFKPGTGNKPSSPGKETGCKLNCAKITKPSAPKK